MTKTLIAQNSVVQPYPQQTFAGSDSVRIIQFNPQVGVGFSGSVVIEGSFVPTPGTNDFAEIMAVTFTGHTNNLTLEVQSNAPTIRARIASSTGGAIAVVASSVNRTIQGSQGATPATAFVDSPNRVSGSGAGFKINSVVVPSITSDDVFYANDFSLTVTDMLDGTNGATGKQDKIGTGVITATEADVNLLTGTAVYGLLGTDLNKLADINATATEINWLVGATSNIQTQLNTLTAAIPSGLTGLVATAAQIDAFFDAPVAASLTDLNKLDGITTTSVELNVFTGTSGTFTAADMTKLGAITASAANINILSGFTGTVADLNKIVGLTATTADLNTTTGYAATGVTSTEIGFLSGLTTNVQAALATIPNLVGLSASVNDLNVFTGIFAGTGVYPNPITATEFSYMNGLVSNIQLQLDSKRAISVPIGISEIAGASITTTELNYQQGMRSNTQAQIDLLTATSITAAGGTLTGPLFMSDGSAAAPGLGFASVNTTGFYRFGANGIGVSVAGTQFLAADGVDFTVGTAAGAPQMKGVGFGITDPAFNFVGDEDTGMYNVSANRLGLVAGGERMLDLNLGGNSVVIGGLTATNNTVRIRGVFEGEKMLGKVSRLAGTGTGAIGTNNIYTVPVGRTAVITKILVVLTNVVGFVDPSLFRYNIGINPAPTEIVNNLANVGIFNPGGYAFDTAGQVMVLGHGVNEFAAISGNNGADYQVLTSGTILKNRVQALAGAVEFDFDTIVFGYEY